MYASDSKDAAMAVGGAAEEGSTMADHAAQALVSATNAESRLMMARDAALSGDRRGRCRAGQDIHRTDPLGLSVVSFLKAASVRIRQGW